MVNWMLMAVPISTIAGLLPTINKLVLCIKGGKFDPALGRDNLQASKSGLQSENFAKAIRCANAESNFYEHWPVYAAGVLAANFTPGVPRLACLSMAYGWIGVRIVYNGAYIYDKHRLRSTAFGVAEAISYALLITAGLNSTF
mmetsp:Transcript_22272/g.32198  ORF Transcript_22272/g.32198 Transcript_22272/m.32198 type:complete len:143 (-) Transcript_22272:434-862(-)|eukprot:CAMPEP_0184750622 /NCGR_PEP_ID=MMETSP0315-20130426/37770_1 /TAXON_ID=101924 /ORGANISM="Rhodosorus marinus, Strain UTEX LB 2760" /LENGTH=142 /DNA_ID=CAMNT_0027229053 /DNA_START=379 /DNA_END=807 /DNA_ORIENTATION=-